jgi:predicted phage replisome organizer
MANKYYWLKLQKDFLNDKRVKKLRKIAGGDTYTVIYLKLMLSTLESEGIITFEGVENTLAEELALVLDEESDNVQVTISFLLTTGLLVDMGENQYYLPSVVENLGSECESANRVRAYRSRKKALQCNADVTECNTEKSRVEKKREDKDIDKRESKESKEDKTTSDKPTLTQKPKRKRTPLGKPSLEEVKAYVKLKSYDMDPEEFWSYYNSCGWICADGGIMKDWKSSVTAWVRRQKRWSKEKKKAAEEKAAKNSFMQNDYDFEALEKELRAN